VALPKLRLAGFDPRVPGAVPVPDSAMVSVGSAASETMVRPPLTAPVADGENVTLNDALCDGLSVNGVVMPLNQNPAPLTDACVTVTLAAPPLDSVTVCDCCVPKVMLPKFSLGEFSDSNPVEDDPDCIPVPVSEMLAAEFAALLETAAVALKLPTTVGTNRTVSVVLCPGEIVAGRLGAMSAKYLVEMAALLSVTALVPELVAVTAIGLLLPTATLPKSRAAAPKDRVPVTC